MSRPLAGDLIRLRGVRHNNLKNFDLDIPARRLIVVTGLSGSGKSSLAFDTLYAEGQRRYVETFSPYARQFLDRMDKPQVDSVQGIPPAIAIEQRNAVKSTRSTVGTMTELCEYMKVVWGHIAQLYCRQCGQLVRKDTPLDAWQDLTRNQEQREAALDEVWILFQLPLSEKLSLEESLALIAKQGYQRLVLPAGPGQSDEVIRVEDAAERLRTAGLTRSVTVLQDRLRVVPANRARFIEACEQAYHFGKGKLQLRGSNATVRHYSNRLHCAACDLEYRAPTAALFSFNHPLGACPTCRGFGRTITIDYNLAVPDPTLTLRQGVVKPWQSGQSAECQDDLMQFCRRRNVPVDVPFNQLDSKWQRWLMEGDPDYGKDSAHEFPHAWYGIKGYFRWLESRAYKMHVRVLLSRYRTYQPCRDCSGRRFQPDSLLFKVSVAGAFMTLADFYGLSIRQALEFVQGWFTQQTKRGGSDPLRLALEEVRSRLQYLEEAGLGYLTLDRPTRSLSGGETERVNLTTCLGSRLVNTLFVLDEPTVGLHPRDTRRLIRILERLRDSGNTVVVVEHESSVMSAADQLIDLGPGHGEAGGSLVFQGTHREILKCPQSITGQYLSGTRRIEIPARRPVRKPVQDRDSTSEWLCPTLKVIGATCHNLRGLSVEIPLERFVCITGVSGSGKTTLVRDVVLPALNRSFLNTVAGEPESGAELEDSDEDDAEAGDGTSSQTVRGAEALGRVILVDQSALGKTPRSNPAVYIGAFDHIRELFAESDTARKQGLGASAFSFNSAQGQCDLCRGAGFEKIEMQFLSDIFVKCSACQGRRYREHILNVRLPLQDSEGPQAAVPPPGLGQKKKTAPRESGLSIADLLERTVDESIEFLRGYSGSRAAQRAADRLRWLQDVGLGYLRLGQPINTLSGGESQRLKLVSHLAEFAAAQAKIVKPTLFLFDEPTTGLHFEDVRVLVSVFQRLVAQGHSVVAVEHNLDLLKCADWLIDLGPDSGDEGGHLVVEGTPETVAECDLSHTGQSLRSIGVGSRKNS